MSTHYHLFETARGVSAIAWSGAGVIRFRLPEQSVAASERGMRRRLPDASPDAPPAPVAGAIDAAKRYFAGERIDFSFVALDLEGQDDLFRRIYDAARRVSWGETTTYGGLAKTLGAESWEMARDVGQAMAKNPIPLIIPCHRVLAAGGKVGGFSAPGGATTKLEMLKLEGVRLGPPEPAQGSLGL